jgi:plastocyanin
MKLRPALAAMTLSAALLVPVGGAAKSLNEEIAIVASGDMSSWGFDPSPLTIPVGATVTWRNESRAVHSVTSREQLFDSRLLDPDDDWSHTFETPGTYRYFCVPHPWMKGTIVVTAPEDEAPRRRSNSSPASGSDASTDSGGSSGSGSSATAAPVPSATAIASP